ncbi:LexA family transcriptional regulator [Shewanella algae]|uniref:Cro/Cl family transcriptional regulator n=1 Tax=Shewanella carassii TaxID=1987584 RepID=A0ABQ1T072_9GAMM|nr:MULTISPECIES: LexA family transcriptional regulator [Shewanella]MBO2604255.1 helix-turn-helix domain-containing protein [Shewanella algae]MCM2529686.1 LexA family transcriptional regulator [Shewanella algae]GGE76164.1 Cro/Cl family transcriptional regulator [Shewanella carassii]HDS1200777.1 helix-turn-helix domain-containing protein [Shewanella algae]HEW9976039.1 helix-turn-helix domain-containing protein [Shewanella algae]
MDISERIKKRRIQLGLTQVQVAERAMTSQTALQKIEAGVTKNPRNIEQLAEALQTTPEFLRFGIGQIDNATVVAAAGNYLPLISMVQAGAWTEIKEVSPFDVELYPCPIKCSARSFIVKVEGESMLPDFKPGDLLYVDPEIQPDSGSYVVARLDDDNQATFKQLILDGSKKYLKALNPDWPNKFVEINGNCTIVGKVVFTGKML